jgi:hypothetical protein
MVQTKPLDRMIMNVQKNDSHDLIAPMLRTKCAINVSLEHYNPLLRMHAVLEYTHKCIHPIIFLKQTINVLSLLSANLFIFYFFSRGLSFFKDP